MHKPICILSQAKNFKPSEEYLEKMAKTIPLAKLCITCELRKADKLPERFCAEDISTIYDP